MDDRKRQLPDGWITNPLIDVTSAASRELVVNALVGDGVIFGFHRWYRGGSGPDVFAITTIAQWNAELERGRAGDNLMVLSLEAVADQAMIHLGESSGTEGGVPSETDLSPAWRFLESTANELAAVTRHVTPAGEVVTGCELIWDPSADERAELAGQWLRARGELWLFDTNVIWQPNSDHGELPKEQWTANHGHFLLDAYIPDRLGRVPISGPY